MARLIKCLCSNHREKSFGSVRVYLGYPRVANLHHNVANQLKNKQSGIQAAKVELILHVVIQDLPSTNHVLHKHTRAKVKHVQKVC